LFVASVICTALWLTGQGRRRGSHDSRPKAGSAERKAQELMGMYGEQHVAEVLAGELPADYVLINGLKLPRGSGDVDHVVVGPNGVFLLETKTMAGRIVCESDGTWRRTRIGRAGTPYAAYIGDPAAQVQRNIVAVRECLRSRMPRLFRGRPLWVQGMVVFAHPRTVLEAEHSRVPAVVLDRAAERICAHRSQRSLQPREVQALVDALLEEGSREQFAFARQSAQAVVEIALLLPVLLGLACGTVALSRLVQAQTAVTAVAHEAARAGALGRDPVDAVSRMRQRADLVAPGLGLNPNELILACDVTQFAQAPAHVTARVQYPVSMSDLPLVGWLPAVPVVQAAHTEWVDPFRSGIGIASGGAGT
jgi:Flp pilus assembly protein TadG